MLNAIAMLLLGAAEPQVVRVAPPATAAGANVVRFDSDPPVDVHLGYEGEALLFSARLPAGWSMIVSVDGNQDGKWGHGAERPGIEAGATGDRAYAETKDRKFCAQQILSASSTTPDLVYSSSQCGELSSRGSLTSGEPESDAHRNFRLEIPAREIFGDAVTAHVQICMGDHRQQICRFSPQKPLVIHQAGTLPNGRLLAQGMDPPPIRVFSTADAIKALRQGGATVAGGPHPEILDHTLGLSANDYPAESLRAEEEGAVRVSLDVDAEGKPTGCSVVQSSGHARLDERTCHVAMERARFRPARDEEGKPIASTWRSPPVMWKIPAGEHPIFPQGESWHATTIQIGPDGTLGECTTESDGNLTIPNACEQTKARHAKSAKEAARWWKSLTDVIVMSSKDTPPNVTKPEWGMRASRTVSAQMRLPGVAQLVGCETILTEGWSFGGNGCPPPDRISPAPPDADWSKAQMNYIEFATFGQPR